MPFAIADLGALALAVIAFLLAIIAALLVTWLKNAIPDPSFLGWHPLGFIDDMLDDLRDWFLKTGDSSLLLVRDLLADVAHIDSWIVKNTVSALTHAFTFIDHLNNAVIPNSIATAVGDLRTLIDGNQSQEQDDHKAAMAAAAAAAVAAAGVAASIGTIRHGTVEGDIVAADNDAVARSGSYTDSKISDLGNTLASDLTSVWNAIGPLQTAVATTLPAEIEASANQAAAQEASDTANLTSELQAQAANLNDNIANAVAAGDEATVADLSDQLDKVNQQIATLSATTTITLPVPADVTSPATITIPLAVTGLATAVAAITTEVDQCMVSVCGGPNNYLNLLQALMTGATLADVLAFIAAAAKDPSGEAAAFESVASGIYTEGHALIDSLLSL